MNLSWKTCFRAGITVFALYLAMHYWQGAASLAGALAAAAPLAAGAITAYILNILMSFYERHWFGQSQKPIVIKSRRAICLLLSVLTLLAITAGVIALVVPQLIACVQLLLSQVPAALERASAWLEQQAWLPGEIRSFVDSVDWRARISSLLGFVTSGIGNVVGFVAGTVSSVFSGVVSTLLSVIFAIYLLTGRDTLRRQCLRLMNSYMRPAHCARALHVLRTLNDCFHRYIVGQCTEALILGGLCTVGMLLLRLPYASMIGALVAFTALIPVAGAYIGAGVGAFMILTVSPMQALGFLVFLIILQQLEGNIIYPRVVGSSIGLPGIWVLAAVTLGGSLAGISGMLLAVPLAAAVYRLIGENLRSREEMVKSS